MSLNSVNTNLTATIALESLNSTTSQLAATQKQISTGYRVADATDDGAAFAVAQRVRSDVAALGTANQQLGNVNGLLSITNPALTAVSTTLSSARDVLVKLADGNTTSDQRTQYIQQYQSLITAVKNNLQDATYSNKSLLGNITSGGVSTSSFGDVATIRNEAGSRYTISTFSGCALYGSVNFTTAQLTNSTTVASLIGNSATAASFINALNNLGAAINKYGSATNYVSNQVSYNNSKIDALNAGLGSLVDADLAKESAQLTSLQIRQQLGTQALSIANQAPSSLLSLFK
jgi:flagellin